MPSGDELPTSPAPGVRRATERTDPRRGAGDRTRVERYRAVRGATERLCEPLATEDYVVQTRENVSPAKWHLAHVSWFFETFLLEPHLEGYRTPEEAYAYLFNSYYVRAGERHCRDRRGWISRPTVEEVYAYRSHVDREMERLLHEVSGDVLGTIAPVLEVGLHHEQQHQELLLTDLKHVFSVNPLRPAYRRDTATARRGSGATRADDVAWIPFSPGLTELGHDGEGFSYDNERPRHREYVRPFLLADRAVTCGEYLEFMSDGGYERPELWLSDGWSAVRENEWSEPFYWERRDGEWWHYTLGGMRPVAAAEPVAHLTFFEAEAFARWAGARLPTEAEWEVAARAEALRGNLVESDVLHPAAHGAAPTVRGGGPAGAAVRDRRRAGTADDRDGDAAGTRGDTGRDLGAASPRSGAGRVRQLFGDVWEWTRSQYEPYPGYRPPDGPLGEYNGKFMCDQFVLRGGSCVTPASHVRRTYRNFFHADEAWQFTGLRLARDR